MPFKHNAARRHRIPKTRYRVQNWPAYEAGLKRRGDLTLCGRSAIPAHAPFFRHSLQLTVVSRRHFFFVAPDWRHVTGTMMAALGGLRGFVGERR